ncbi:MAG: protein arginine kinase [Tindallia sp. MSAO_Bac2]|nr:MAG: protein arginine kinase [Tindallia sp. MSAO_Bac2]
MNQIYPALGPHGDIVMSSRVRIARNLEPFVFPHLISDKEAKKISDLVKNVLEKENSQYKQRFQSIKMHDIDAIDRQVYVEDHTISPALASNVNKGELLVHSASGCSVMIHEEDHIRIQCLLKGLQPEEAFMEADALDDWMGKHLSYAFDERLGFLTACPTNTGTGLRASVMLHLPALTMMGYLEGLIRAAGQLGFAVRGVFGEGTAYLGNLYQISNQITLGIKEQEIIANLEDITEQVIHKERMARQSVLKERKLELEDRVYRSLGTLKYARLIQRNEAMQLISDLILGTSLGVINQYPLTCLNELMEQIQPANLQKQSGKALSESERDQKRAELISATLEQGGNDHVDE